MDLESRMREKSKEYELGYLIGTVKQYERGVKLSDALQIAREYAEEYCKKQREICAEVAFTIKQKGLDGILPDNEKQIMDRILNRINNAPLATEARNGK